MQVVIYNSEPVVSLWESLLRVGRSPRGMKDKKTVFQRKKVPFSACISSLTTRTALQEAVSKTPITNMLQDVTEAGKGVLCQL